MVKGTHHSDAARARISEGQRRAWADPVKRSRRLALLWSPERRRQHSEAMRAWAAKRERQQREGNDARERR